MEGNVEYERIWENVSEGKTLLIDTRIANEYTKNHVPQSLCAPYSRSGWGSTVAQYVGDQFESVAVLATNRTIAEAAAGELQKHGYSVEAAIPDGIEGWESRNLPTAQISVVTPEELNENKDSYRVIDVREPYEWQSGTIPGALKIPMNELPDKLAELSKDDAYAIVCASGSRSMSAALFLADNGFKAGNVEGGMSRWLSMSLPVNYD